MNHLDRRFGSVELETRAGDAMPRITGYAALHYDPADRGTEFDLRGNGLAFERILPGAFTGIETADVVALLEHNRENILGRTTAGTLRLSVDQRGLRFSIDPPDSDVGRRVVESLRRGDLRNSSFGFLIPPGGDNWKHEGRHAVREIRRATVKEISLVAFPAYSSAISELTARSLNRYAAVRPLGLLRKRLALQARR